MFSVLINSLIFGSTEKFVYRLIFRERIFVNDQPQVKDHFMSFDSTILGEFIVILIFYIYKRSISY